jgi:hypothetical protein
LEHLTLAVQQAGPVRTETLMGREYRVVPARLVKSQVLNNNLGKTYLPESSITDLWAQMSNDAPVVLDHPTRRGIHVSGRSKDVLNARGLGRLYHVRVENSVLKGDVFLDPSRRDVVPELGIILAKVDAGEPVELSTAFPVHRERSSGVFNGRQYDWTIYPTGPLDHLAVFTEKRGACSVADGCGLGVNHEGECIDSEVTPVDEEKAGVFAQAVEKLIAFARNLGGKPEEAVEVPSGEPAPEPAANATGNQEPTEDAMNREQLIAALAQAGPLDKEALNKLSDCALKALSTAGAPAANGQDPEMIAILQERVSELRTQLETQQAEMATAVQAEKQELLAKQEELVHNGNTAFTRDEIRAMGIRDVRKLYDTVFPRRQDYTLARGVPRAANTAAPFSFQPPAILGGRAGDSVFDRKEN